jgi:TatD DNase family protein
MTPLVDIGANLAHDSFDVDRDAVRERASAAGVVAMIVTGSTLDDTDRAIALCRQHPQRLRATAGVHPHHATGLQGRCGAARRTASDPMVVAAGECGLDYFRNFSPPAEQRRAFELQLSLAEGQQKPLSAPARRRGGFPGNAAGAPAGRFARRTALLHRGQAMLEIASRSAFRSA